MTEELAHTPNKGRPGFIPEIEVLRGFAIALTFFHHFLFGYVPLKLGPGTTEFLSYFGLAFGVDIFFAISGFVITRNLLQHYQISEGPGFWSESWRFWKRRMWRLYPAAWFTVLLAMTLSLVFYTEKTAYFGKLDVVMQDSMAAVLHYFNWYGSRCAEPGACGPNQVYWSLSLEEQFYFVFPFLMLISGKHFPKTLVLLLAVQLLVPRPAGSIWNDFRSDGFILGALLAMAQGRPAMKRFEPAFLRRAGWRACAVCVLLVAAAILTRLAMTPEIPYAQSGITILAATLVFLASYNKGFIMPAGRWQSTWQLLGARAYTIYLIHILAFGLVVEGWYAVWRSGRLLQALEYRNLTMFVSAVISTLLIAELIHRCIEKPFIAHHLAKESAAKANKE